MLSSVRDEEGTRVKCWSISLCAGFVHSTRSSWVAPIPGAPASPGLSREAWGKQRGALLVLIPLPRMWCRRAALYGVLELHPSPCCTREWDPLLHPLACPVGPPSALLTPSHLVGAEKCQKPQWEPRFIFDQEQETFNPDEVVQMRCPEGHWPPPMEIKCVKLNPREGSTIPRSAWFVRNGTGFWHRMESNLTCVGKCCMCPTVLVPCAQGGQSMVWAFTPDKTAADASQVCVHTVGSRGTLYGTEGDESSPWRVGPQAACPDQPDGSAWRRAQ